MQKRVLVSCRQRPGAAAPGPLAQKSSVSSYGSDPVCVTPGDVPGSVRIVKDDGSDPKQFAFDAFFPPTVTQADVYSTVAAAIVQSVTEGYNGTILAYGQTGSGKTHTLLGPPAPPSLAVPSVSLPSAASSSMSSGLSATAPSPFTEAFSSASIGSLGPAPKGFGVRPISRGGPSIAPTATLARAPLLSPPIGGGEEGDDDPLPSILFTDTPSEERGIIPRSVEHIFDIIRRDTAHSYSVYVSYVQIYCELVHDLLSPEAGSVSLPLREDVDGNVYVEGVTREQIHDAAQGLHFLARGHANRAVARTKLNSHSSRSHAVYMVSVEKRPRGGGGAGTATTSIMTSGCLFLVDLAGSERVKKSGVVGTAFSEMKAINLSLAALGNVIAALAEQRPHIPYRDSKLTRLLQKSLGGNAMTALVVTVAGESSHSSESMSTLQFGSRAKLISVKATVNEVVDYKAMYLALQARLDEGVDSSTGLTIQVQSLEAKLAALQREADDAKRELASVRMELDMSKSAMSSQLSLFDDLKVSGGVEGSTDGSSLSDLLKRAVESVNEKWKDELERVKGVHSSELVSLNRKHAAELSAANQRYEEAAAKLTELEYELSTSRDELLEALTNYRKCTIRVAEVESELANRVGELVVEVEALNQTVDSQKEEVALAKERVQRAEQAMKSFKDRIESDYVSRQQVTELESLYSESMQRLASRVESLEGVRRAGSSPAVSSGGASGGPPVDRSGARHSAGLPSVTSMASGGVGGLKPARVPIQASGGRGRGGAPPNVLTVGNAPGLAPIGRGKAASGLPAIPSSSARMVPGGSVPSPMAAWSVPVPAPVPVREEDLGMDMHDARALLSSILSGNRAV